MCFGPVPLTVVRAIMRSTSPDAGNGTKNGVERPGHDSTGFVAAAELRQRRIVEPSPRSEASTRYRLSSGSALVVPEGNRPER